MTRKRIYRAGRKLTLRQLCDRVAARRYVMMFGKPMHPGWVGSMQFNTLSMFVRMGAIREAIRND